MGIIQRQSISGFIFTLIGVVLGFLTTGLIMPRIFETDEIGLLRVIISYATVLSTFAVLGFSVVSVKMFPFFRDEKSRHHGFFGLSLMVGLVGFVLASIIYLAFHDLILEKGIEKSPMYARYFYLAIPLTFFLMLYTIVDTYFRVLYQAVIGIVFREIVMRLLVLAVFALFYFQFINFTQNVYLYSLAFSLPAILMLAILIARGEYSFVPDFKFLKRPLLKKIGHVGLFGLVSSFSGVMVLNIDILMLNHFEGLAQTGIYTITFFFGALVLIPSRSMAKISSVIISDAFKRKDLDEVDRIYKKSSINLGIVGVLVFIGLWANSDNIFQLIGEDFRPGYLVILFIGLANLFDMFSGISSQIFFNSKYYTISAYLSFSYMVVLIVSNLIFIPYYGIIGAAVATLLSKFLYNAFKYVFLLKKFRFQPFDFKSFLLIVLGLSTMFLIQFLPYMTNYIVDIGLRSLIIVIVFSLGVYFLKLSDDINIWVDKIWKVYLRNKF